MNDKNTKSLSLKLDQFLNAGHIFLSALYSGDAPQWVHNPFMTKDQVITWVKRMDANQYSEIEIFNEETLKIEFYLKEKNDEFIKCNLREYLIGSHYSAISDRYDNSKKYWIGIRNSK